MGSVFAQADTELVLIIKMKAREKRACFSRADWLRGYRADTFVAGIA